MTYPKTTKLLGDWNLQVVLSLDRAVGQYFVVGDHLSGKVEIINNGTTPIPLRSVNIFLNERVKGAIKTEQRLLKSFSLIGKTELLPGQRKTVRFRGLGTLQNPSFRGKRLSVSNRISVRAYSAQPANVSLLKQIKLWGRNRNNEFAYNFEVPTKPQRGVYQVAPRHLPTKWLPSINLKWTPFLVALPWLLFLLLEEAPPIFFHWAGVLVILLLIALIIGRITLFRDSPMEIVESPGGSFLVRMLDRGDNSWQSLHLGYRITETYLNGEGQHEEKLVTKTLHRGAYSLKEIGQVRGSFIEARLPWPKDFYPNLKYASGQGFGWEFTLLRKNILGNWAEVKWPINVSWEHLPPPEEVLELKDLTPEREILGGTPGATNNKP
ncbi:hypothetical protein [Lewinella sp. W8]|uniref:hypothetical protein n=1 Tax=Lewinella sp. W8 TaxID=2528208 RepID=UPI00106722DF|nr:hypothetical protein [Lewinella sp. W8]MTB53833.1 hypothetical protein [Lewinella sp. W8]